MPFRSSLRDSLDHIREPVGMHENNDNPTASAVSPPAINGHHVWDYGFHGKLYNRSNEKSQILKAYNRMRRIPWKDSISSSSSSSASTPPSSSTTLLPDNNYTTNSVSDMIIIQGATGVGKTALARSLRPIVQKDGGYFVSGKFDQILRPEPFSVFVGALTEFCDAVMAKGEDEIKRIRTSVSNLIKTEQKVLIDMVPALKMILLSNNNDKSVDDGPPHDHLCVDAVNRFKYVFRMFIRAIASRERPIVVLLDDLHWADESSLDLLDALFRDTPTNGGIISIGTYREDAATTRLQQLLLNVNSSDFSQVNLTTISLTNFDENDVNNMLAEVLKLDADTTRELANVVYCQTNGNVFFIMELLRWLYNHDMLKFQTDTRKWTWDIDQISEATATSLQELITSALQSLPSATLQFLQYASSLGTRLEENVLKHLVPDPMTSHFPVISSYGFIEYDTTWKSWKFTHDGIKEATYSLIPSDQLGVFHYRLGRKLWRQFTVDEIDHYIFVVVGQLLLGSSLVLKQEEQIAVAKLCFRAGEKSVQLSHFRGAFDYLSQAMSFLSPMSWREEYEFCLNLYNASAEVAYCIGDFDSVMNIVNDIRRHAKVKEDTMQAQSIKLYSLGSVGRLDEAIETGLSVLKELGEFFPSEPSTARVLLEIMKVRTRLNGKSDSELLNLPLMTDQKKLAAMKIMSSIFLYVYMDRDMLPVMMGLRMLFLTLKYGKSAMSSSSFCLYGILHVIYSNNIDEGFRYGRLGLQMYEMFNVQQWIGRMYAIYYGILFPMKLPITESIAPLKYAYLVSLEKGDVEFGFLNGCISLWVQFHLIPLPTLDAELQSLLNQMSLFGQYHSMQMMEPMRIAIQDLLHNADTDLDCFNENIIETNDVDIENKTSKAWSRFYRMFLCYHFGRPERAYHYSHICMEDIAALSYGDSGVPMYLLYIGLIRIDHAKRHKSHWAFSARKCLKLIKIYACAAPINALGKQHLLQAELFALAKKNTMALVKFTSAIALAKESGYISEIALGNERAAKFLHGTGDSDRSKKYFNEALTYYSKWGAITKVRRLQKEIKQLLGSLDGINVSDT